MSDIQNMKKGLRIDTLVIVHRFPCDSLRAITLMDKWNSKHRVIFTIFLFPAIRYESPVTAHHPCQNHLLALGATSLQPHLEA